MKKIEETVENNEAKSEKVWDAAMFKILFIAFGLPILVSIMIASFLFEFHDSYADWNKVSAHIVDSSYLFNVPKSPKIYKYSYSIDGEDLNGTVTSWNDLDGDINVYVNPDDFSVSRYSSELNTDLIWTLIVGFFMGGVIIFLFIEILLGE